MNDVEIVAIAKHPSNEQWRHIVIRRDGGDVRAICFDGPAADGLTPGSLPESWSVKEGTHGPIVTPPRKPGFGGGGGGGFRNSREGVEYEQAALDRRMAVQAAARAGGFDRATADAVLAWLKGTSR